MTPALQVVGLTKFFGALCAVNNVTLELLAGERRAILGPNGAGKTTLFNLVAGDFLPTRGSIFFFGEDIGRRPAYERTRLGVSRTYQNSLLFKGLSVVDNLFLAVRGVKPSRLSMLAPRPGDPHRESARDWARRVGLAHRMEAMVSDLSHGEQRQLELGMALAAGPRLLLLDEPAAGLSQAERPILTRMLRELPRTITVLLIEHDMDVALQLAERVTVMHNGATVFEGTPKEAAASAAMHNLYLGSHGRQSPSADSRT
jgi:branched-chain amino acid transport system ATP-binding protein